MTKKNQTPQTSDSSNSVVELTDKDLQQVVGGAYIQLQLMPPNK